MGKTVKEHNKKMNKIHLVLAVCFLAIAQGLPRTRRADKCFAEVTCPKDGPWETRPKSCSDDCKLPFTWNGKTHYECYGFFNNGKPRRVPACQTATGRVGRCKPG